MFTVLYVVMILANKIRPTGSLPMFVLIDGIILTVLALSLWG